MIADLQPYPATKDSSVKWLGEVPSNWAIMPGRACFGQRYKPNIGLIETTVLSLSYGRLVVKPAERLHGLVPVSFETYQIIEPGDIVIRPTDLQNDWNSLRFGLGRKRGIITSAYLCFRTKQALTREYGYLLLHSYDLKKVFYGLGSGLRQNLDWSDFKYLPCLVPPSEEQFAIVRFVDYMDRRIRRYVQAKRKLIKLLEEQQQAIIHSAVTGQIDVRSGKPYPTYKPSSVEWLGNVPEHWEMLPNRTFLRLRKRLVGADWGNFVLLSLTKRGVIPRDMENPAGKFPTSFEAYQEIEPGDLVFCLFDIDETPRFVGLSELHGMITSAYARFSCDADYAAWIYYFYLALDNRKCLKPLYTGLRKVITKSTFLSAKLPVPPSGERLAILEHVQLMLEEVKTVIDRTTRELALVSELKSRLVADVVTGKLDVREAAARLPEEDTSGETTEEEADEANGEEVSTHDSTESDEEARA